LKSSRSLNIGYGKSTYEDDLGYLDEDVFSKPELFEPVSLPVTSKYDYQDSLEDLKKEFLVKSDPVSLPPVVSKRDYREEDICNPFRNHPGGIPLRPMFKPIGMDQAPWNLMPTPPGFIKF